MKRFIVLILVVNTGCFSTIMDDEYGYINPVIKPYIDLFVQEAKARGIEIDTSELKIDFGDLGGSIGGITNHRYDMIIIDSATYNWRRERENTIFHELGHLFLHRKHDNAVLKNGNPKSIMNDGSNPARFTNNPEKRDYYINELFNPKEPSPNWAD